MQHGNRVPAHHISSVRAIQYTMMPFWEALLIGQRSILAKLRAIVHALSKAHFGEHHEQTENIRF